VAKAITLALTNSISSDRNKNQNLSCHSNVGKNNNNNASIIFTFVLIYTRISTENHTQMHSKLNGLTFPHKIRKITYGMLRAGVGNHPLQQPSLLISKKMKHQENEF
jgi:hypothetical protein